MIKNNYNNIASKNIKDEALNNFEQKLLHT